MRPHDRDLVKMFFALLVLSCLQIPVMEFKRHIHYKKSRLSTGAMHLDYPKVLCD